MPHVSDPIDAECSYVKPGHAFITRRTWDLYFLIVSPPVLSDHCHGGPAARLDTWVNACCCWVSGFRSGGVGQSRGNKCRRSRVRSD